MDHIDGYEQWSATNSAMEDSLASWGPDLPQDFVHDYEVTATVFYANAAPEPVAV